MPSHRHVTYVAISGGTNAGYKDQVALGGYGQSRWWDNSATTVASGGSQPHNNMPPYAVVNVWKRTA